MTNLIKRVVVNALALWFTVLLAQNLGLPLNLAQGVNGAVAAVVTVIILALVNATLGTVLKLLTFPLTCLTLGLWTLVVNGLLFWLVGALSLGFSVGSFWAGLFGSIVYSLLSSAVGSLFADEKQPKE